MAGCDTENQALLQHHQVLLKQNQIRGFLGDVGGGVHRNSDVRRAQGRSVVDSIAHESDDVAIAPEGADDTLFMRGREAGEQRDLYSGLGKFGVGHFLDVTAQQHGIRREAHVGANLTAYQGVIPSEDFYGHAILM